MIVLDTNVISESMRPSPDANVRAWLNNQSWGSLFVTTISITELRYGIERLPEGKRKEDFWNGFNRAMARLFDTRILAFDTASAEETARILSFTESAGRKINTQDSQIAGITKTHGFSVATRDITPFEAAGVNAINPWLYQ